MKLYWQDQTKSIGANDWQGLLLDVEEAENPGLIVEMCTPRCLRVSIGGEPRLWARVEYDYWGYDLVRSNKKYFNQIIPPIDSKTVEQHSDQSDNTIQDKAWARHFAAALQHSKFSPLFNGKWRVGYIKSQRQISISEINKIIHQKRIGYIQWDFGDYVYPITLRDFSDPDSGRVKAWRKRAREGKLPPILLLWISGFCAHVVIDGHDRLLACSLEDLPAPVLYLEPVTEVEVDERKQNAVFDQVSKSLEAAQVERQRPKIERLARAKRFLSTERANELLLSVFSPELETTLTRASIINGGQHQWKQEVLSEVTSEELKDTILLDGLS